MQYWSERLCQCQYVNITGHENALLSKSVTQVAGMCSVFPSPFPAFWSPQAGTPVCWLAGWHTAPQDA